MPYTSTVAIALGASQTSLSLAAAITAPSGTILVKDVTAGFFEIGAGNYIWAYDAFVTGARGAIVFYTGVIGAGEDFSGVTVKAIVGLNPEDADVYYADIDVTIGTTNDGYTCTWYKNGVRETAGITVPTLEVVDRASGGDLIATTAMTQIGTTGSYKYNEPTARLSAGSPVLAIAVATIDGTPRTYARILGRDQ